MDLRRGLSGLVVTASLLMAQRVDAAAPSLEPGSPWRLALHGGWWDAGFDVTSPQGVFLGVGAPWVLYLPILKYSGQEGLVALDASVGYRLPLSARTSLYGKLLTVWSYDWGDPCGDGCTDHTHRLYFFPVAGIRHRLGHVDSQTRHAPGAILGIDLALAVWSVHHTDDDLNPGWRLKNIPIWAGVAFSQVYAGYEW
jgi:hypothetical protein